jgi:hypothetical protein
LLAWCGVVEVWCLVVVVAGESVLLRVVVAAAAHPGLWLLLLRPVLLLLLLRLGRHAPCCRGRWAKRLLLLLVVVLGSTGRPGALLLGPGRPGRGTARGLRKLVGSHPLLLRPGRLPPVRWLMVLWSRRGQLWGWPPTTGTRAGAWRSELGRRRRQLRRRPPPVLLGVRVRGLPRVEGRGRRGRQRRCATRRARRGRTAAALILLSTLSGLLGAGREGVVWFVVGRA